MRITLDSNQLVRALMRPPQLATFIMAWEARRFSVVASRELVDEYDRVLSYPAVAALIYPELLHAFRSHLMHDIEVVALPNVPRVCRDPDDDKVLATALYGEVDFLVTADEDLRTPEIREILDTAGIGVTSMDELIDLLDRQAER
jgi:putative PIN family toxin of toxin-antitoxin system